MSIYESNRNLLVYLGQGQDYTKVMPKFLNEKNKSPVLNRLSIGSSVISISSCSTSYLSSWEILHSIVVLWYFWSSPQICGSATASKIMERVLLFNQVKIFPDKSRQVVRSFTDLCCISATHSNTDSLNQIWGCRCPLKWNVTRKLFASQDSISRWSHKDFRNSAPTLSPPCCFISHSNKLAPVIHEWLIDRRLASCCVNWT